MSDFFQRITEDQGTVEDLIRKIPGFKGYFAKQDRRAADRLLREYIARRFETQLSEFNRLQRELIDAGGIMYMEQAQRIDLKLRTFIDRIESAAQGYAGLFAAVKVREADLEQLYAFDNGLLAYQDQLSTGLNQLEEAIGSDGVKDVLRQLESVVTEANETFKRRVEVLQSMSSQAV